MDYKEDFSAGRKFRDDYLKSIEKLLDKRMEDAKRERELFVDEIIKAPEKALEKFKDMLGWPLNEEKPEGAPKVKETFVASENGIDIIRLQLEILPEFWYYGILFRRNDGKRRPFFISQHGGQGTPELCSSMLECGSAEYNDMTSRILKYDVNVFSSQMLLWNIENYGTEYNRTDVDNVLKQCGGSITALEVYALTRVLDYFEVQPYVDPEQIGMVGMSYGGMFTLYTSAIDKRIKGALSCSYFCDRFSESVRKFTSKLRPDWVYSKEAKSFFDAQVAMLVYPRKIYFAIGNRDEMFDYKGSLEEFECIKKHFPDWEKWTCLEIFDGTHEFCPTDILLEKLMEDFDL